MSGSAKDLLAPYIAGDTVRPNGDVDAHCPLPTHPAGVDRRRSAVFNFKDGVYYCNTEGRGGSIDDLLEIRDQWIDPPSGNHSRPLREQSKPPAELPSEDLIKDWRRDLMRDTPVLEDLLAARGLWTKTLDVYEIGWDQGAQTYTIPIRDQEGKLQNVRRYQIRPLPGRRKIWGIAGHNKPRLFPLVALKKAKRRDEGRIIICEGEWDALICNQYNFRAITRTSSARNWNPHWAPLFKGLIVYLCHDMDKDGQSANHKVARSIAKYAREVRVIRLPYAVTPDHGKDLTDWWLEHDADRDAFQRLVDEAVPYDDTAEDPEEIDPSPAKVIDAFDSRRVSRPLALTVTVKGRREPGYSVPRKVQFRCTRDAGNMCAVCPLFAEDGEADEVIAGADPAILEMVDASKSQVGDLLRRRRGVPKKCPKVRVTVSEHQAVEVLYARPSVEHSNGGNADYKSIKLTSVGRHDTSPNQTVRVVGALHPGPKSHLNEFLTWDVTRLSTSLDRFEADAGVIDDLRRFQPRSGQRPLHKLREIADDLSAHTTQIVGRPTLHAAMDLVFHSVIGIEFDGKELDRGWLELLVVGDTRSGKSEAAKRLTKFYGAGEVVSCEGASFAGIIGGAQQFGGNKEWAITWGAIPLNDRRLVVLDEVSNLTPEEIGAMSSVRSSGIAEITKIAGERTHARTRLIWIGNPRNSSMKEFTYGVQAIKPLIGNPEDIARFDLAMSTSSGEVPSSEINRARRSGPQKYPQQSCRNLLRWVWSRGPGQIEWADGATETIYEAAEELGRRYVEDPPLIQVANVREKVARIAVAIAGRLFSTDTRAENIIVRRCHVRAAVSFIDVLYGNKTFGYGERSRETIKLHQEAQANIERTRRYLSNKPGLLPFLRGQGKFRRPDLEEILDIDREEANAIISQLYDLRMVYKDKGDVKLTPTLHELLRED